ncbi:hypothetical protein ABX014_09545 [Snodgrassella alvi]|uniref:hypothetical protein n=1 Tax=Snodgrassella alvi TaxID=1196083 RepID=UPI00351CAD75
MITRTKNKANYNQNENEFNLPDITFPAEALELWEENPKKIFNVSELFIPIYIEKLEASERDREKLASLKKQDFCQTAFLNEKLNCNYNKKHKKCCW